MEDARRSIQGDTTQKEPVRNIDYTVYEENIYVGYRYFDTFNKAVSYPFGFGFSYTNFEYENPAVRETNGVYTLTVDVKNTGKADGKEVVQLYVSAPTNGKLPKPLKELKAFAKTKELKPDEKQTVTLTVATGDLASFDEAKSAWVTDSGTYKFLIGASSADIRGVVNVEVNPQPEVKTSDVLKFQASN
jgi:beta-glucosidase